MIQRIAEAFLVLTLLVPAGVAVADVRSEQKSHMKFEGGLGRMMNMFGGSAARDGVVTAVAIKGDRRLTTTGQTGQIVDLQEETVYDLDFRRKQYTVTTFAEMRQRMEEARRKAAEQAPRERPEEAQPSSEKPQIEIDFDLKESGQKRAVNGFDAREVVMTVVAREKGKTLEEAGGLVLTTSSWLTPAVPALQEVADFDRRYAEKLHGPMVFDAQQMAMMAAMYPMLSEAMARMQKENVNMDGTAVLTIMKVEAVPGPEQAAAAEREQEPEAPPTGVGGLAGRLGRRVMRRDRDKPAEAASGGRTTVFTMQQEVLKVTPSAGDADVAIPAGFEQK